MPISTMRTAQVADRTPTGSPLRSSLMMLGVMIGISALAVIVSLGEGSKRQVLERMKKMGADKSLMVRPGAAVQRGVPDRQAGTTSLTLDDAEAIAEEVSNIGDLALVMVRREAATRAGDRQSSPAVFGVTPIWRAVRTFDVERGELFAEDDLSSAARVCLLGRQVVTDLFGEEDPLGRSVLINSVSFQVKGVLESKEASLGGGNLDNRVLIPLTTFSRRLFHQNHLDQIVMELSNASAMHETAEEVRALLRERHRLAATAGARRRDIVAQFMAEATVARFVETPPALSWVVFGLGFAFSALVGIVFGVSPARKAASLDPVEALR